MIAVICLLVTAVIIYLVLVRLKEIKDRLDAILEYNRQKDNVIHSDIQLDPWWNAVQRLFAHALAECSDHTPRRRYLEERRIPIRITFSDYFEFAIGKKLSEISCEDLTRMERVLTLRGHMKKPHTKTMWFTYLSDYHKEKDCEPNEFWFVNNDGCLSLKEDSTKVKLGLPSPDWAGERTWEKPLDGALGMMGVKLIAIAGSGTDTLNDIAIPAEIASNREVHKQLLDAGYVKQMWWTYVSTKYGFELSNFVKRWNEPVAYD